MDYTNHNLDEKLLVKQMCRGNFRKDDKLRVTKPSECSPGSANNPHKRRLWERASKMKSEFYSENDRFWAQRSPKEFSA
jgi:hypothetical protein